MVIVTILGGFRKICVVKWHELYVVSFSSCCGKADGVIHFAKIQKSPAHACTFSAINHVQVPMPVDLV